MDIESFIPNPVNIKEVQPKIPIIVIKNLFLYLNIFLIVTFCEKFSLFHINFTRSNKTLFPSFGAFGLNRFAGFSFKSLAAAYIVAPTIQIYISANPDDECSELSPTTNSGIVYIILYIIQITLGINCNPITIPITPPIIQANVEYNIYLNII